MLAAMQACAYAAAGESRSCRLALDEAGNALTLDGTDQAEPEWLDFDEGGYWGHAARAYRDLGQYAEAERCARKSVGLCLPGHSRTRAQRTAIYATAYLRLGEIDAAAAAGEQLVRDAWNLQSGHVFGEVAQLRAALARLESGCAADFLDQARELLACPGTRARCAGESVAGHDDLERLGQPALWQPGGGRVRRDALPQPVSQAGGVRDLARMCPHCCHLPVEGPGDVDVVIDLPLRAVQQPCLAGHPPVQAFVAEQVRECEGIAGVRVDRGQGSGAGGQVCRVGAAESLPVPLRAPGDDPLRADLADDPDEILVHPRAAMLQLIFAQAEELNVADAQQLGGLELLGAAHARYLGTRYRRVKAACVAIGEHAIRDLCASVGPPGDRPPSPELRIVRMRHDHEHSLHFTIR